MNNLENNPEKAAKVFADDRANVFHSWSAQAQISPMAIAGAPDHISGILPVRSI